MPRKRYLDNAAPADNTARIGPILDIKRKDTPARRKKEQQEYEAIQERNKRIISTFSRTPAGRRAANRAYTINAQKQKQQEAKEEAAAVVGSLFKPLMPSTYVDMAAAVKSGQVNDVSDLLAAPYLEDSWSARNPGKALATDIVAPFVVGKGVSVVNDGISSADKAIRHYKLAKAITNGNNSIASFGEVLGDANRFPIGYQTRNSFGRYRLGDVELNNPNLLYSQKQGTIGGMFGKSEGGSVLKNTILYPGKAKQEGQLSYSWFNKGKPYVNTNSPILITSPNDSRFLHVRSQPYPIGQWDGTKGFVTNSEYVTPYPIKGSIYKYEPNYGYRIVSKENNSSILSFDKEILRLNSTPPFYYDEKGNIVTNPNYYFRRGWGIIDDALETGVIRVPPGDYKKLALEKYPWLDNGNPFSTTLMNHTFPYFSEGKLWPTMAKLGVEPEDLIAIPKYVEGAKWVGGSKWGKLLPDVKPSEVGGRATPLIKGETNKFPTSKAKLYRLDKHTNRYVSL